MGKLKLDYEIKISFRSKFQVKKRRGRRTILEEQLDWEIKQAQEKRGVSMELKCYPKTNASLSQIQYLKEIFTLSVRLTSALTSGDTSKDTMSLRL